MLGTRLVENCLIVVLAAAGAGASATSIAAQFGDERLWTNSEGCARHLARHSATAPTPASAWESKIRFDLARLNPEGLHGPPDGLRALHYEYCIPDRPETLRQVAAIDPSLEIQRRSPGRVGCEPGELLCLGHTHQAEHRAVLEKLASLPFIVEIREAFFE